jgi:hypothetical protein
MESAKTERGMVFGVPSRGIALGIIGFVVLIVLNVYSMMHFKTQNVAMELQKQQNLESFAEEYNLTYNQY